jgi:DNA-binding MarR family transcriptional regulator
MRGTLWGAELVTRDVMDRNSIATLVEDLTARLSGIAEEFSQRAAAFAEADRGGSGDADPEAALVRRARHLMEQRRLRARYLPAELFHEPAWDMLLALYVGQHERRTMNVKTLVSYSDAPATTSQRWIDHLHKLGLIHRITDMVDRRRVEIQLTEPGEEAIRRYLRETA